MAVQASSSCGAAFESAKTRLLKRPDKSLKGSIDAPMYPLVESVNSTEELVSTSCCSGRISLFAGKKKTGGFVFCSHDVVSDFSEVEVKISEFLASGNPNTVNFKFEPLLLHVEASSLAAAERFLSLAINFGFRNSGILALGRRVIVAVRGSLRLEFPIIENFQLLVSTQYLRRTLEIANDKLTANLQQISDFHAAFIAHYFPTPTPVPAAAAPAALPAVGESEISSPQFFGAAKLETAHAVILAGGNFPGARSGRVMALAKAGDCPQWREISVRGNFRPRVFPAGAFPYVFGGRASPDKPFGDLWKFDEISDQLVEVADAGGDERPCARYRHCAATDAIGNFFVLGGVDAEGQVLGDFWKFSEISGWQRLPDAPQPTKDATLEFFGDKIYLLVGNLSEISVFHIDGHWSVVTAAVVGDEKISDRSCHASTVETGSGIFLAGGSSDRGEILRDIWKLEISSGNGTEYSWKFLGFFPQDNWRMRFCLAKLPASPGASDAATTGALLALGGGGTAFTFGAHYDAGLKISLAPEISRSELLYVRVAEKTRIQETRKFLAERKFLDAARKIRVLESGVYFPVTVAGEIPGHELAPLPEISALPGNFRVAEKFERLGDTVLLPAKEAERLEAEISGDWAEFCRKMKCRAVGILGERITGDKRESNNRILFADGVDVRGSEISSFFVTHAENGVKYTLDLVKHMFSSGNGTERKRMRSPPGLRPEEEVVVDLFAGIGYFSLPLLLSGAQRLVACDWNESALDCLKRSLPLNKIPDDRVIFSPGDSATAHERIGENFADRISLGLIPSSEIAWPAAARILKNSGGWLHVHGVAADVDAWSKEVVAEFEKLGLEVTDLRVNKVKNYRPKVRHYVLDLYARRRV